MLSYIPNEIASGASPAILQAWIALKHSRSIFIPSMKVQTKHKRAIGMLEELNEDVKHMSTATYVGGRGSTMSGGVITHKRWGYQSYTDEQCTKVVLELR